jgi:muconolactone delta-isomerase
MYASRFLSTYECGHYRGGVGRARCESQITAMKILALERDVAEATPDAVHRHLTAEAQAVWDLQQAGTIREIYFRADRREAVLMLECANAAEARAILSHLPLVAHHLVDFEVIPLAPYPGFDRLFASKADDPPEGPH